MYWVKKRCEDVANKCNSRSELKIKYKGAYESARLNGWLDDICKHMVTKNKPSKYWTKDRCKNVIDKCSTLSQFYKNYNSAYQSCVINNWLDELTINLKRILRKNGYWTKEKCIEYYKKCNNKKEFIKLYPGAYNTILKNNWLDDINKLKKENKVKNKWIIYSYIIGDYFYVGVTINEVSRKNNHLHNSKLSSVNKFLKENNINLKNVIYKVEKNNIVSKKEAKNNEKYFLEHYIKKGLKKINKKKVGNLGNQTLKWTFDKCKKEALKYKTKKDFRKKSNSAYNSSIRNGWLDEISIHLIGKKYKVNYWNNLDNIKKELKKYSNIIEFKKNNSTAYRYIRENNWFDIIYSHYGLKYRPINFWENKIECQKEVLKYKTKTEFKKGNRTAYNSVLNNGWFKELCKHMKK